MAATDLKWKFPKMNFWIFKLSRQNLNKDMMVQNFLKHFNKEMG